MLFILVMDVLNSLFVKAANGGLLQPRLSLNADDVAIFIKPLEEELQITRNILKVLGDASRLQTNI